MSRALENLDPDFRDVLKQAVRKTEKEYGVKMVPFEGYRSPEKQAQLWRRSRSTQRVNETLAYLRAHGGEYIADIIEGVGPQRTGPWATNAIPGKSFHQYGMACDLYWEKNGVPEWVDLSGYAAFAGVCRDLGLTSGYFWTSRDAVHVQAPSSRRVALSLPEISDALIEMRYKYA